MSNKTTLSFYCLKIEDRDFFKIGITSRDVRARVCDLQVGCPYKLEIVLVVVTQYARKIETLLKKELFDYRTSGGGEWFRIDSARMTTILNSIGNIEFAPIDARSKIQFIMTQIRGGLSQAEMAEKYGTTEATICASETGRYIPSRNLLAKLARYASPDLYMQLLESLNLLPSGYLAENAQLTADRAAAEMRAASLGSGRG